MTNVIEQAEASLSGGRAFLSSGSGRWAGEQLMRALKTRGTFAPADLRTLDTLRRDEWIAFDETLIEEATLRLRAVGAVIAAGLTVPVTGAMGKTIYQYEKMSEMNDAEISLDGRSRTEDDAATFSLSSLPLPITHKDFGINLRTLLASRSRGESLDTTQARVAGRKVAEKIESTFFLGGPTFGGNAVTGLLTQADRNTAAHGTNGLWSSYPTKTGANMLADVLTMMTALEGDRYYGPYILFLPRNYGVVIENDFKADSDKTIRQRLAEIDGIRSIVVCDQLTASNMVLAQASVDVMAVIDGEPVQTIQWDIEGGMEVRFKAMAIQVPLIRSDNSGRSGVFHMSGV